MSQISFGLMTSERVRREAALSQCRHRLSPCGAPKRLAVLDEAKLATAQVRRPRSPFLQPTGAARTAAAPNPHQARGRPVDVDQGTRCGRRQPANHATRQPADDLDLHDSRIPWPLQPLGKGAAKSRDQLQPNGSASLITIQ